MSKEQCHSCEMNVYMQTSPHGRNYCPNCGTVCKEEQRDLEHNQIEHIVKH